jgi:uncharacterized membrane protein
MPRPASFTRPGFPARPATWALVAAAVLVQIVYPLIPDGTRTPITVLSVLVFAAASLADAVRTHGPRGGGVLLLVAGGGGLLAEAVGVHTGFPFGSYAYTGTLGPQLLGVPVVVPFAWVMMAWPALVVGRTLGRHGAAVAALGGGALAGWDVFLDPQMVAAGHWRWADPTPALPGAAGIPLTNYAGWLTAAVLLMTVLDRLPHRPAPEGQPALLYLWTYASQVLANLTFFGRPTVALLGGLLMGLTSIPYAYRLRT